MRTEEQKAKKRERAKRYRENHKEEVKESRRKYKEGHKEKIQEYNKKYKKQWDIKNKEKIKKTGKLYREKNRKRLNEWFRNKRLNDPNHKISDLLRKRVSNALKGITKSAHTMELVGCSIDFAREHLQQTAIKNGYLDFDINNWVGNDYHIDHIIPCASFDLTISANQFICFNWSNLQILSAKENISKGDKIL